MHIIIITPCLQISTKQLGIDRNCSSRILTTRAKLWTGRTTVPLWVSPFLRGHFKALLHMSVSIPITGIWTPKRLTLISSVAVSLSRSAWKKRTFCIHPGIVPPVRLQCCLWFLSGRCPSLEIIIQNVDGETEKSRSVEFRAVIRTCPQVYQQK